MTVLLIITGYIVICSVIALVANIVFSYAYRDTKKRGE